jgi:hypothetical protein
MRLTSVFKAAALFVCAVCLHVAAQNKINPQTQINWPQPSCASGVYSPVSNTCVPVIANVPIATLSTPGIVKPDGITTQVATDGSITVNKAAVNAFGIVKADNLTLKNDGSGVLSAATATTSTLGVVKPDNATVQIAPDGTLSVPAVHVATLTSVGVMKPDGTTTSVSADGTLTAFTQTANAVKIAGIPVTIPGLSNRQYLSYDAVNNQWINTAPPSPDGNATSIAGFPISGTPSDTLGLFFDAIFNKWVIKQDPNIVPPCSPNCVSSALTSHAVPIDPTLPTTKQVVIYDPNQNAFTYAPLLFTGTSTQGGAAGAVPFWCGTAGTRSFGLCDSLLTYPADSNYHFGRLPFNTGAIVFGSPTGDVQKMGQSLNLNTPLATAIYRDNPTSGVTTTAAVTQIYGPITTPIATNVAVSYRAQSWNTDTCVDLNFQPNPNLPNTCDSSPYTLKNYTEFDFTDRVGNTFDFSVQPQSTSPTGQAGVIGIAGAQNNPAVLKMELPIPNASAAYLIPNIPASGTTGLVGVITGPITTGHTLVVAPGGRLLMDSGASPNTPQAVTFTAGAAAGSSPTISCASGFTCTNRGGTVAVVPGSGSAAGVLFTFTWPNAAPGLESCTAQAYTPANVVVSNVFQDQASATTTTAGIRSGALTAGSTVNVVYTCN